MFALWIVVTAGAYGVGTFPTAQIVGRRIGRDPTREGSGNPGATNVYRTAGRRAGLLVGLVDVLKGAAPAAVGYLVDGRPLATVAWAAAVAGHVLPVTRWLRGGKGVATAAGGAAVLHPLIALALGVVFVVVARATRRASLGSLAIAVLLPVGVAITGRPAWEVGAAAAIGALVLVRHAANLRRLFEGTEQAYKA
ncbi:MAG TPA: glycerol-3-phosphate acyltransferase [Acidimicrobiales bacterium]|nr:glycerol-3-phosphate acyltransferase [Acidimicrobiales bacterium]